MSDWYEVVAGSELQQGDLVPRIGVLVPKAPFDTSGDLDSLDGEVIEIAAVVLTQSCDLIQNKVEDVLLGQVIHYDELVAVESERGNDIVKSRKFREKLIEGNVPNLSLLTAHDSDPALGWSVVNFRRVHSMPVLHVAAVAAAAGDRLRLLAPYREHLAQAFARYLMRVGLPLPADEFRDYQVAK